MSNLTRRSAINTLVGAAALSALPVAASAMAPDPIFAAIERYKASYVALGHVLDGLCECERRHDEGSPELDDWERREDEFGDAERAACDELIATVPTTFAGVLALLRYVSQEHELGNKILVEDGFEKLLSTTVSALSPIEAAS